MRAVRSSPGPALGAVLLVAAPCLFAGSASAQEVISARFEPVVLLGPELAVAVRALGDDPGEVVLSRDRGATWRSAVRLAEAGVGPAPVLCFGTARVGMLVGPDGVVLRTADGGRSFRRHGAGAGTGPRSCVLFGGSRGYLVAGSRLLFTFDGGRRWREVGPPSSPVRDACFSDSLRGAVATDDGLHVTANGGRSWTLRLARRDLTAAGCSGRELFWAGTQAGEVLASADAGLSWSRPVTAGLSGVSWLRFAGPRVGFAVGTADDAARTTDGGRSWRPMDLPEGASRPSFLTVELAYVGGGALHLSRDQGVSWTTEDPDWAPSALLVGEGAGAVAGPSAGSADQAGDRPSTGAEVLPPGALPGITP